MHGVIFHCSDFFSMQTLNFQLIYINFKAFFLEIFNYMNTYLNTWILTLFNYEWIVGRANKVFCPKTYVIVCNTFYEFSISNITKVYFKQRWIRLNIIFLIEICVNLRIIHSSEIFQNNSFKSSFKCWLNSLHEYFISLKCSYCNE